MEYQLSVEENADPGDVAFVEEGLRQFNLLHVPPDEHRKLAILAKGADGELVGGLLGDTAWHWLYISILWLREDARGSGLGARLMAAAEEEARRRGCLRAAVDTMDFQAPGFYEKLGYTRWGVLEDWPAGHQRIYYRKTL